MTKPLPKVLYAWVWDDQDAATQVIVQWIYDYRFRDLATTNVVDAMGWMYQAAREAAERDGRPVRLLKFGRDEVIQLLQPEER